MKKKNISQKDILTALNDGDVVFGESKKKGDVKVYVVEKDEKKDENCKYHLHIWGIGIHFVHIDTSLSICYKRGSS